MRKKSAFLNHITHAAPNDIDLIRAKFRAIKSDLAAIGFEQADDQTQQRGFAATARSNKDRGFATVDRKIESVNGRRVAEGF